jgi:hypothetical protein
MLDLDHKNLPPVLASQVVLVVVVQEMFGKLQEKEIKKQKQRHLLQVKEMMVVHIMDQMVMAAVAVALVALGRVLHKAGTVVMDHHLLLLDLPKLMLAAAVEEQVLTPPLLVRVRQVVVMVVRMQL